MISKISLRPLPALGLLALLAIPGQAVAQAAASVALESATVQSQIVARLALERSARPRWGRFSPVDPDRVLLDIAGQAFLASLPGGMLRRCGESEVPVGWLGGSILVRDTRDGFRILDPETLKPRTEVATGSLALPWTLGREQDLTLYGTLPATGATAIPSVIPGANVEGFTLVAREEHRSLRVSGAEGSELLDATGRLAFRAPTKIYGSVESPDGLKVIVYLGNTDHILFNRLTGRSFELPREIEAWYWWPDNSTLLGLTTETTDPRFEEVAATRLYVYEPGGEVEPIALPAELEGLSLQVLDLSAAGRILVEAERTVEDPAYLGVVVLEVAWR